VIALLPELQSASERGGRIEIDAAGVEQVGQALLQLLLSARKTGDGASINPSAALLDAAALTGLEHELFDGDCNDR
jgi:hypothetical protein